ncbi:MAG: DUF6615 family protein [Cyclobacteriaceae bacterium]
MSNNTEEEIPDNERHKLCKKITECGTYISEWLTGQPNVGEESLTDWFLYELDKSSLILHYEKFNKREEAKTGADWLWEIVFSDESSISFLVQAKKVSDDQSVKKALTYPVGKKKIPQMEILLRHARSITALPFYCFYTIAQTENSRCSGNKKKEGVFWTDAHWLNSNGSPPPFNELMRVTTPIACLFCCDLFSIVRYLTRYFREFQFRRNLNNYIKQPSQEILNVIEVGFSNSLPRLKEQYARYADSIVIVDLREA